LDHKHDKKKVAAEESDEEEEEVSSEEDKKAEWPKVESDSPVQAQVRRNAYRWIERMRKKTKKEFDEG
jgi:hypothetical protein